MTGHAWAIGQAVAAPLVAGCASHNRCNCAHSPNAPHDVKQWPHNCVGSTSTIGKQSALVLHVLSHHGLRRGWALHSVQYACNLSLWWCCCPVLLLMLLQTLLLLPLVPCRWACADAMLHADKTSRSSGLCGSQHRCSCAHPQAGPLRCHACCCMPGCCKHMGLQSSPAPCQRHAAPGEPPAALLLLWTGLRKSMQ
jgi:hypothetical protein